MDDWSDDARNYQGEPEPESIGVTVKAGEAVTFRGVRVRVIDVKGRKVRLLITQYGRGREVDEMARTG